jgi:soluble lytic murein transglycosylase-like protein
MNSVRRSARALAALLFCAAALTSVPAAAQAPQALSPWDAQLYSAALDATKRGDFKTAEETAAKVQDKSLLGFVEFEKLFHPTAYKATYDELVGWLRKYGDLPVAQRVRALARKRQAEAALTPPSPEAQGDALPASESGPRSWASLTSAQNDPMQEYVSAEDPRAARLALNDGQLSIAYALAVQNGDNWIAALASYRQKNFAEARRRFEQAAWDPTEDPWVRSGAAFWAARSAVAEGKPQDAPGLLRLAADFPFTFYGLVAERQLGIDPQAKFRSVYVAPLSLDDARTLRDVREADLARFVKTDDRARRAVGLMQIGMKTEAQAELRTGLRTAADDGARRHWTALAEEFGKSAAPPPEQRAFRPEAYPAPELDPKGGFTVEKALVYALIRKESRFDPKARSSVGAYGLMQVMPETAAWLTKDARFRKKPQLLLDAGTNLRVGQDYLEYLLSLPPIDGDVLRTVAAYNGGPAPVFKAVKQLGDDADPLLIMESIPVAQTRAYVEEVMAAYWIYIQLGGEECLSLEEAAAGKRGGKVRVARRPAPNSPLLQPTIGGGMGSGGRS